MDTLIILIANLILWAFIYESGFKNGQKETAVEMRSKVSELNSFVFNNAYFTDSQGRGQGEYNSTEVASKWSIFHKLNHEIDLIGRGQK